MAGVKFKIFADEIAKKKEDEKAKAEAEAVRKKYGDEAYKTVRVKQIAENYGNKGRENALKRTIGFDTLQNDLSSMGKTIEGIYGGWQTPETMKNTKNIVGNMQRRINAYQEYRKLYGGDSMPDLTELASGYSSILDGWDDLSKDYAGYKSANEYKDAVERRASLPTADINALNTEIGGLEEILSKAKEYESAIANIKVKQNAWSHRSNGLNTDVGLGDKLSAKETEYANFLKNAGYSSVEELKKVIKDKTKYRDDAQNVQDFRKTYPNLNYKAVRDIEKIIEESGELNRDELKRKVNSYIKTLNLPQNEYKDTVSYADVMTDAPRKPNGFWQGTLHSAGYLGEKILAGALSSIENLGDFAGSLLTGLGSKVTTGEVSDWLGDASKWFLERESTPEKWSENIETRYRVPDAVRYVGTTAEAAGNLALPILTEALTLGASPWGDIALGQQALTGGAKIFNAAKQATKASDVMFGLSAAGSAAKQGYDISGDVDNSLMYGALTGLGEVATEKIFGGFAGTDIGDSLIDFTVKNTKIRKLLNFGTEGVEEIIMSGVDPFLQRATVDKDAALPTIKELGESGMQGVLLSLFMGAATYPITKHNKSNAIKEINAVTDGFNEIIARGADKFVPLKHNATEGEIHQRQAEIKERTLTYREALEQAAMDFAAYKKKATEQQTRIDTIKKAMGYGEYGAKEFSALLENSNEGFEITKKEFQPAYELGMTNPEVVPEIIANNPTQRIAFNAGKLDYMANIKNQIRESNSTIIKGTSAGFKSTNNPSDVTSTEVKQIDAMSKLFGVETYWEDDLKGNAEIKTHKGVVLLNRDFERSIMVKGKPKKVSAVYHAFHEILGHRLIELAPKEGNAFISELYRYMTTDMPDTTATPVEGRRAFYGTQNVSISTSKAMEEIMASSAYNLLYETDDNVSRALERIASSGNKEAMQGMQKYKQLLTEFLEKLKEWWNNLTGKEKAEAKHIVDEVARLRDMFEKAASVAVKRVQEAQNSKKSDNQVENGSKKRYNGSTNYSLYSYPQLSKAEWELLNNRLQVEIQNYDNYIDEYTKWLYASKNGTRVFAIYGIGWGDDATPLYAVGGKKADKQNNKMQRYMEGKSDEFNGSREDFESWLNIYTLNKGKSSNNIFDDGNRGTSTENGSIHSGQQASNGKGINGGSTEDSSDVSYSLKESGEGNSIKEQLKQSRDELDKMDVIARIDTSKEFKNAKEAYEWAVQTLKQSGYKVERLGFGTIIFDEKRIKNGLQYLKTEPEYTAYALIPKVLKKGLVIGEHSNHKSRGYGTITFAAPVEIDGIRGSMAIVVRMEGKNYYKLHRVLMPDGGLFEYKKGSGAETAAATTSVVDTPTDTTSNNSISQTEEKSQEDLSEYSLKEENAVPERTKEVQSERAQKKSAESSMGKIRSFSLKELGYEDKKFDFEVTQSDINQYVEKAYLNQNEKSYIKFLKVQKDLIDEVSSNVDISGYSHALRDNDIRHIKNSHGEKTNEKYPVTEADIELIPYVVENYDKVLYKTNANGNPGLVYVKVMPDNVIYYVEAITTEYNGEKLLVNKQMVKTGIDNIPNLYGLVDAINKKQSSAQYLADLQEIRKAYVQDVKENYSVNSISQTEEKSQENLSEYSLKEENDIGDGAIDLTNDKDLSIRIANQRGSKKYKIIRDYILETLGEKPITLSDGIVAKVDRSDALHLANKSANKKVAYISKIKTIVEQAKFYAVDTNVEHKKFDEFRYYQANVKYGNETYPVYLNVGRSKNGDGYHIYDITRKIGAIAKQKNALERVENDLRSEIDSPISSNSISQTEEKSQENLSDFSLKGEYELYDELVEKYGAIPKGENPARDVLVPKKTSDGRKVSQTVRTILEARVTPDEALPSIEELVTKGEFSYDAYTDKDAIAEADETIAKKSWEKAKADWYKSVGKGEVSKKNTALGWAIYNNAVNSGETETALEVLDFMVRHQRSAAQALQAARILKKLSPETQLYGVQKSVNALQEELKEKYGKKAPDLEINKDLAEKFLNAQTSDERAAIEKEIYRDIGRQMPSRFIDKWNAWRYLSMLGNARTHIRNVVGNAGFAPIVLAKNLTATAIESAVYRVSGKKTVRGKALITGNKADRALLKAAWGDYAKVADLISNGGKYNDSANANQYIEEGRKIFKLKPLEWARKGNSKALEAEDMWFAKPHYAYALAQYCKANNITAEQISRGRAMEPARAYAIKEAQKATYRDTNAFSQTVSSWGRNNSNKNVVEKAFSTVVEGVLPFRKTPANILVRGVEYSPIGLLKGLAYDLVQVGKGKMSAAEAIDNISAGLTGTGLLALGVYLAAQGFIRGHGGDDEDEKEFEELMGHQGYSLELPNGSSITLDWLAPEALPFFVGVNIWEVTKGSKEKANLSSILSAVSNISEPMLEMSCLQSLNDLFESVGYATSNDTSGFVSVLSSAITSYLTQGIPTLFGQIERSGEENRMTTYTEKNDFLTGDMQYTLGKASAKIPFWDYNQIPYIDAWGRKEASGAALKRGFNNFLNPAYTSEIEDSNMERELLRLYERTGEGGVFPERADKYFTVDGVRKDLTADEYVRYATLKGEKSYKLVSDLVKSKAYKKLSDEGKVKAVKEAYDYANQKAKQTISNYKPDAWVEKADEFGSNAGNYISFKTEISGTKEENGGKISKQEVVDIVLDMAQNDSETWKMYLSMYDSEKDMYAFNNGIEGEDYMGFLASLDRYDKPTKSGKYGTYTQEEAERAIRSIKGLSQQEKAILWQSVNTSWKAKNNPFR